MPTVQLIHIWLIHTWTGRWERGGKAEERERAETGSAGAGAAEMDTHRGGRLDGDHGPALDGNGMFKTH